MKKTIILLLILFMVLFILGGLNTTGCKNSREIILTDTASFIKWAAEHAVPVKTCEPGNGFKDLLQVKNIIGNAKIVCLGESRHDIHEQFRFKHRMVEFLVKEMGFTTFIMEESLPYTREIDSFLQTGNGDAAKLLEGMPMWFIWDTEEILAMVKWMRNYNANPNHKRKIRFFGMDVTAPLSGMKTVREYLGKIDRAFAESVRKRQLGLDLVDDNNWTVTMQGFNALSAKEKRIMNENYNYLVETIRDKHSKYIPASSQEEYRWALRLAEVGRESCRLFTSSSLVEGGLIRDRAMADNVKWIMQYVVPGERVIIWASNPHIGRKEFYIPGRFGSAALVSVGCHLSSEMPGEIITIAATFNRGDYSETSAGYLDGVLARVGLDLFMLDLRRAPAEGPVARWLNQQHWMYSQDADILCTPGQTFDAVYFIDSISRTTLSPTSKKRLAVMRERI